MRHAWWVGIALVLAAAPARADDKPTLNEFVARYLDDLGMAGTTEIDRSPPKLGLTDRGVRIGEAFDKPYYADAGYEARDIVIAWSADKSVGWVSANLALIAGGMGDTKLTTIGWAHGAAVIVPVKQGWHGVVYSVRESVADKDQADALAQNLAPPKLERSIGPGAAPVAKLFESTIATPKALAASVSTRDDVVLFGSSHEDRVVGGAAVAAALLRWNLRLGVRDGVRSAVVGTKVAWVAANVDATKLGDPKARAVPYQVLAVYEKTDAGWKIVQLTFAFQSTDAK